MSYYLAPSLVALRSEIDRRWPDRDTASDGWIGDASHQASKSDHNPDYSAGGVVRAIDIDKDGIDVGVVLDAVIGDDRVWYVIWDRNIYSRTYNWERRAYNGSNPHDRHIHVSIRHDADSERDTSSWLTVVERTRVTRGKNLDVAIRRTRKERREAEHPRRKRILRTALKWLRKINPRKAR